MSHSYNYVVKNAFLIKQMREGKTVTKAEAIAHGCDYYYTGKPCCRGHTSIRSVKHGFCRSCRIDAVNRKREMDYVDGHIVWKKRVGNLTGLSLAQRRHIIDEQLELARIEKESTIG